MPVDEDVNLDNPDGLTQEDLDILKRQAEELAVLAEDAEKNADKINKSKKSMEGLNFAQLNLLSEGPTEGVSGEPLSQDKLTDIIVDILKEMKEAEKERREAKTEREGLEDEIKKAERERKKLELEIKGGIREAESDFNQFLGATNNPVGFAKGKLMGYVGKAGLIGAVITTVYSVANTLWEQYMKSFKDGGANDIRKLMDDRDKEMAELNDILARRNGMVFFTGDVDLRQGAPQFSNTERLRDGVLRYQALHLGE